MAQKNNGSLFELLLSFLLARWLWKGFENRSNKDNELSLNELTMLHDKLEKVNKHWDSI